MCNLFSNQHSRPQVTFWICLQRVSAPAVFILDSILDSSRHKDDDENNFFSKRTPEAPLCFLSAETSMNKTRQSLNVKTFLLNKHDFSTKWIFFHCLMFILFKEIKSF